MLVDLVQTTTRDGIRLDGALQVPSRAGAAALPVDGVCLVHGTGGSFYSSQLFDAFTQRLQEIGCPVLRVNTRGHDLMSTAQTARGGRRQGAAYETVDDCRHDLAAWLGFLRERVGPRVGLIGHSLGAVKAIHALGREPEPGAACLVALSPPRLSYAAFCASAQGAQFLETYQRAEQLVTDGKPETLLEVQLPLPFVVTAAGYVEKYGPDERYNFLRLLGGLRCPALFTFGSNEVASNMAFRGLPEEVAGHAGIAVETIAGADHFYSGVQGDLIQRVENWLALLS